jgi:hypothetical protein
MPVKLYGLQCAAFAVELLPTPKARLQSFNTIDEFAAYTWSTAPQCSDGARGATMKRAISAFFCLVLVFSAGILVFAKGTTTRITIAGAGLPGPIEIKDPKILENFNVWSGPGTRVNGVEGTEGFIVEWASGVVTERPNSLREFEVSFHVRYANRRFDDQTDQLAYVVLYSVDSVTGQGYVYLPGRGDEHYVLNTRAILRRREGNWFRATAAWQSVVKNVLRGSANGGV